MIWLLIRLFDPSQHHTIIINAWLSRLVWTESHHFALEFEFFFIGDPLIKRDHQFLRHLKSNIDDGTYYSCFFFFFLGTPWIGDGFLLFFSRSEIFISILCWCWLIGTEAIWWQVSNGRKTIGPPINVEWYFPYEWSLNCFILKLLYKKMSLYITWKMKDVLIRHEIQLQCSHQIWSKKKTTEKVIQAKT